MDDSEQFVYKYLQVARKTREIAMAYGKPSFSIGFLSDRITAYTYVNDKLYIKYSINDEDYLIVKIDDTQVLSCDFDETEVTFQDGNWTELIDYIYSTLPKHEVEGTTKLEEFKRKKELFKKLHGYFKYYIDCSDDEVAFDIINSELDNYGFKITKDKYFVSKKTKKRVPENSEKDLVAYEFYIVKYNDEEVVRFQHNQNANINHYAKIMKPGLWQDLFISAVINTSDSLAAMERMDEIDKISSDMIMKLKKDEAQ